jgi:hypothetical protein
MKSCRYLILVFFTLFRSLFLFAGNTVHVEVTAPENVNAGNEFQLNIEIQKSSITGFSKLELFFPVGFKPKVVNAAGATCVIQNELVKMIWLELPGESNFIVSISVCVDRRLIGYKEIYGNFHYVENKERKKSPVGIIPFYVKNENKSNVEENNNELLSAISKVVVPGKNLSQALVYRVQIAAYRKRISKDILLELYGVPSSIKEEMIDGLYKYTIGDFATKEDADIFRISCGVSGAFIVSYENGVRVINK